MTRIFDVDVIKVYFLRLPKWYVYAHEGLFRCNALKIREIRVIRLIRDSEERGNPRNPLTETERFPT